MYMHIVHQCVHVHLHCMFAYMYMYFDMYMHPLLPSPPSQTSSSPSMDVVLEVLSKSPIERSEEDIGM